MDCVIIFQKLKCKNAVTFIQKTSAKVFMLCTFYTANQKSMKNAQKKPNTKDKQPQIKAAISDTWELIVTVETMI